MSKYHNAGIWSKDLKMLRFMFKNIMAPWATIYYNHASSWHAARGARICETRLFLMQTIHAIWILLCFNFTYFTLQIHLPGRNNMMTSSNGNIFRVSGLSAGNSPVTGEFPSQGQWRGALMFWSAPEQTIMQTIKTSVIWDAIALIMTSL